MLWVYIWAVVAATIAAVQCVAEVGEQETRSRTWSDRVTLHASAILAIGLFVTLLVGGFLVAPWWWPPTAMVAGATATAVLEESRLSKLAPLWVAPIAGTAAGLTAFLGYLNVTPS